MVENSEYAGFIGEALTPEQEHALFYHDSLNSNECSLKGHGDEMGDAAVRFLKENGMTFMKNEA